MTRLATMGTSSCATMAISGWKSEDKVLEEAYLAGNFKYDPEADTARGDVPLHLVPGKLIYPLSQPMGESYDYPFSFIMDWLDGVIEVNGTKNPSIGAKFIILTLNDSQYQIGYWKDKIEARGFKKIDQSWNNAGEMNHIFTRNTNFEKRYHNYEAYLKDHPND